MDMTLENKGTYIPLEPKKVLSQTKGEEERRAKQRKASVTKATNAPQMLFLSLSLSLSFPPLVPPPPKPPSFFPPQGVRIFGILVLTTTWRLLEPVWMKHPAVINPVLNLPNPGSPVLTPWSWLGSEIYPPVLIKI
jgi:protein-S-isoprenylcysteine O-methyltransferase Ste14